MTKTILIAGGACALVAIVACSSDEKNTPTNTGIAAGAVTGPADSHCGAKVVKVSAAACTGGSHDHDHDAGEADASTADAGDDTGGSDYGETLYNAEGDDDDCKYHMKWALPNVAQNADETFTVTLTNKSDGTYVQNAPIRLEVFLNDTHPAPNSTQTSKETSPGIYSVGPIQFDASGKWTVRFHFNEQCEDAEDSPHGHAAFYVQVP